MNAKIVKLFKSAKNRPKIESCKSQKEVKKGYKEYAILCLSMLTITHIIIFLLGVFTLQKLGLSLIVSSIIIAVAEFCVSLALVSISKYSIAKKQSKAKEGDVILSGDLIPVIPNFNVVYVLLFLLLIAYYGSIGYVSYFKTLSDIETESSKMSYSDSMQIKNIGYIYENDTTKASRLYKSKRAKIESKIKSVLDSKTSSLLYDKAEITRTISWCKSQNIQYSEHQNRLSFIEQKIKNISIPQYLTDSINDLEQEYNNSLIDAKRKFTDSQLSFIKNKKDDENGSILLGRIKSYLLDLLLLVFVLIQLFTYMALIQYLNICNISIFEIFNIETEQEKIKEDRLTNEQIDEILSKMNITRQQLSTWKLRSENSLVNRKNVLIIESVLDENDIKIEWSGDKMSYPKFYKLSKKTA